MIANRRYADHRRIILITISTDSGTREMSQRIVVLLATIAVMIVGAAIATVPVSRVDQKQPPIVLSRLGRGNRVFIHHDMKTYSYSLSGPRSMPEEAAARVLGRTPLLNEAWEALEAGNREWESGNQTAATAQWRVVARKYHGTNAALAALAHIGQAARLRGDIHDATVAYVTLVAQPDALEPEKSVLRFDYSNDKHDACVELSDIFIESNDLRSALKYAELAQSPYHTSGMCGVTIVSTHADLDQRIEALRHAIAERRTVRLKSADK